MLSRNTMPAATGPMTAGVIVLGLMLEGTRELSSAPASARISYDDLLEPMHFTPTLREMFFDNPAPRVPPVIANIQERLKAEERETKAARKAEEKGRERSSRKAIYGAPQGKPNKLAKTRRVIQQPGFRCKAHG